MVSHGRHVAVVHRRMVERVGVHIKRHGVHRVNMRVGCVGVSHDGNVPPGTASVSPGVWQLHLLWEPRWGRLVSGRGVRHGAPDGGG